MRLVIMHKTNAHWESGAVPTPDLVKRVGAMIGDLAKAGVLRAGEGLRPSSQGVRLTFSGGARTVVKGPLKGQNELPAGFSIVRVGSLDEAIEWAARQARAIGDVEMDIRPVTEPWDIGMGRKPANVTTTRYMVLRKATPATEAGVPLSPTRQAAMARLVDETRDVHLVTETMRPSARGRRYKNAVSGVSVVDGPFAESKEMVGGYVIVEVPSLDEASRWAERYIETVGAGEVDVREME
jgi:hypothetical protein